jgi:hypothetical protein
MKPIARILVGVALVLIGILTASFFGLLLAIADCSTQCQANHERLVPIALIILGIGLTVTGVLMLVGRLGARPASSKRIDS